MHTTFHRGPSTHWFAPSFTHSIPQPFQSYSNQHWMGLKEMRLKYKYRHGLMHTTPHRGPSIHWFAPSLKHALPQLFQSYFNQHLMDLTEMEF